MLILVLDDAGSACRGAINMRIARLHMDAQDKTRFEIHGKSSVKYHLKANHVVEAKRWFWSLNNAIQFTKDEAKEEEKRRIKDSETLRHARNEQHSGGAMLDSTDSIHSRTTTRNGLAPPSSLGGGPSAGSKVSFHGSARGTDSGLGEDGGSAYDSYEPSVAAPELNRTISAFGTAPTADGDDDEYDDASSHEMQPANKDAFNITAQSAKLQLDLLARISTALQSEKARNPEMVISDPTIVQALSAYETAVNSLNGLVIDLLKISRDRDAYWQYKLDREVDARKMWEDSMTRVAREHEDLQSKIGESEDKRKRTKRALKEALESASVPGSRPDSGGPLLTEGARPDHVKFEQALEKVPVAPDGRAKRRSTSVREPGRRKSIIAQMTNLSDSESGDDEEFFDAIDAGEVEVLDVISPPPTSTTKQFFPDSSATDVREMKKAAIEPSYKGYQDPVRKKLTMDADNRPKISLWVRCQSNDTLMSTNACRVSSNL